MTPLTDPQVTDSVLLVQPFLFGINEENENSNSFIEKSNQELRSDLHTKALEEFHAVQQTLSTMGTHVYVFKESKFTSMDSIFPNNWFSTHSNGTFITYPMLSVARRDERSQEVIGFLKSRYSQHFQLEDFEEKGVYLEGTGSLVLDRKNKIAYAGMSERTHIEALNTFEQITDFEVIRFHGTDKKNSPVYHTNVLMSVGSEVSIVCLEAIKQKQERHLVERVLGKSGRSIVEINIDQLHSFAGNCLELRGKNQKSFLIMSEKAYKSLIGSQTEQIQKYLDIVTVPIPSIEMASGGSVRCMIAELF